MHHDPDIAGALPRHEALGAKAVDLVLAAIAHHDYGPPAEPMNLYIPESGAMPLDNTATRCQGRQ